MRASVQYDAVLLMLWGCSAAGGLGALVKIDGIIND